MKRILSMLLVALVLLTGCVDVGQAQPVQPEPVLGDSGPLGESGSASIGESSVIALGDSRDLSIGESTPPSLAESGETPVQALPGNPPSLPDFEALPLKDLPFAQDDLFGEVSQLRYEAMPVGDDFLQAVAALDEETFAELTSSGRFFEIGEYMLYLVSDSPRGPSTIAVESPDGSVQTILSSYYAVNEFSFLDRKTLNLQFSTLLHYEGGSAEHYAMDLSTAAITPSGFHENGSGHGFGYSIYRGRQYVFHNAKKATELGEASDIYLMGENGALVPVLEYVVNSDFSGEHIYYVGDERTAIYRADLDGKNSTLFRSFDTPLHFFYLRGDKLRYSTEEGPHLIDLPTGSELPLLNARPVLLQEDGYYAVDDQFVLYYAPYGGDAVPLLANFKVTLQAATDDALYFSTYRSGDINRYDYWKIQKDGSNLIQLNA